MKRSPVISETDAPAREEQYALVQRILASAVFGKSARLREFLEYISDRALAGHHEEVNEQLIGHRVFGRVIDYNPADDNNCECFRAPASDQACRVL